MTAPSFAADTPTEKVEINADNIRGEEGLYRASGHVFLRKKNDQIYADLIDYDEKKDSAWATGQVRFVRPEQELKAPKVHYRPQAGEGEADNVLFTVPKDKLRVTADKAFLRANNTSRMLRANYTTCQADDQWAMTTAELELDHNTEVGVARDAKFYFKSMPLVYSPYWKFSYSGRRESGFLPPVIGYSQSTGIDLTVPYYFNLAENYDNTTGIRHTAKRGQLWQNEFRYLTESSTGQLYGEWNEYDTETKLSRGSWNYRHDHRFNPELSGQISLTGASDPFFYRDYSDKLALTSQVTLPRETSLVYKKNEFSATLRTQSFQVLQDPLSPIIPPYEKLPQLHLAVNTLKLDGWEFNNAVDWTYFYHPTLIRGQRYWMSPSLAFPLRDEGYFFIPKLRWHHSGYAMVLNGESQSLSRDVPIMSIDSGLIFERDGQWGESRYVQTLEPRLLYTKVPYRDQSKIPIIDTAESGLNYSELFNDNRFQGQDRINDADQITLGISSRWLSERGVERFKLSLAQRLSLIDQQVVMPGSAPLASGYTDYFITGNGRMTDSWWLDSTWQYSPKQSSTEQFSLTSRFQPAVGKVLNLAYRYTPLVQRQVDVSGQWPLGGGWYGVARNSYSLLNQTTTESLAGFEYNAGCWSASVVVQRFYTSTNEVNQSIFMQLKFGGIGGIGFDPYNALKASIPGYSDIEKVFPK